MIGGNPLVLRHPRCSIPTGSRAEDAASEKGRGRAAGVSPTVSADGSTLAFIRREGGESAVHVMRIGSSLSEVARTTFPVDKPALSPTGDKVAYQVMPQEDWELMVVGTDGSGARLLTKEIQRDLFLRFLTDQVVLAVIGEGRRHRRSYLYDVDAHGVGAERRVPIPPPRWGEEPGPRPR